MLNNMQETKKEETKTPAAGSDSGELKDEQMDEVAGGRASLNPQPLPPHSGGI